MECRCLVCGDLLAEGAMFSDDPRVSEVCSKKCAEIYFNNDDECDSLENKKEHKSRIIIKSLLTILLLSSCDIALNSHIKYADIYKDLPIVDTINEAWMIAANIEYVSDSFAPSYREPRDTYYLQKGDCEDIAALFLAVVIKSGLGSGYVGIIEIDLQLHAITIIDNKFYEAQICGYYYPSDTKVYEKLTLKEYIKKRSVL